MLVDFTVSNFRSIRDPVTLSLIECAPGKRLQKGSERKRKLLSDDEIAPALQVPGWDFKLLRSAAIYGANASGKSNVVRALIAFLNLLDDGPNGLEFSEATCGFRLDPTFLDRPTRFELRLVAGIVEGVAVIGSYTIGFLKGQVVEERLEFDRVDSTVVAVERGVDAEGKRFSRMSDTMPNSMRELEANLAPEVPFLHLLVRNFEVPGFPELRQWLRLSDGYSQGKEFIASVSTRFWMERDDAFVSEVVTFVRDHDTMLGGLRLDKREGDRLGRLLAVHQVGDAEVVWDLSEESAGTRQLIDFAGPILRALKNGTLLVLDEFGAHLHSHLTERIVQLFHSPATNPRGAQLVFNTHDTRLLEAQRLRRDQVWFTEKHPDGHTELFALHEFRLRNDAALDKAYLSGALGAVPVLSAAPRMTVPR